MASQLGNYLHSSADHGEREALRCPDNADDHLTQDNEGCSLSSIVSRSLVLAGALGSERLRADETAAFALFLYGRMIGTAAEIDDHLNRGRNMDTRTPAGDCGFVT